MSVVLKAYQVLPVVPQFVGLISHLLFLFVLSSLGTFLGFQASVFKNELKKDLPWYEFNRRLFPVRVILHACAIFFPIFTAVYLNKFPHRTAFLTHTVFVLIAMSTSYLGSASTGILLRRKLGVPGGSLKDWWNSVASDVILLRPHLFLLGTIAFLLFGGVGIVEGFEWLVLLVGAGISVWMHTGGYIIFLKVMSVVLEPSQSLQDLVKRTSEKVNVPAPKCFEIPSRLLNAFAWPLGNYVGVTRGAIQKLSTEELETVLFHELGHLAESPKTKWSRVALTLVPILMLAVLSYFGKMHFSIYLSFAFVVVLMFVNRFAAIKISQAAEKEADKKAAQSKEVGVVFAKALEKIYRENFYPAVVNQTRSHYPSLYDRMTTSGVAPSFPRPTGPSKVHGPAAMLLVLVFTMVSMVVANKVLLRRLQRSDISSAGVGFAVGAGVANARMFSNLAAEKIKAKQYQTASILYAAASELDKMDPIYPTNLARSLAYERKCEKAVNSLKRARTRSNYFVHKFGKKYDEGLKFHERLFASAATVIRDFCYAKENAAQLATKKAAAPPQKIVKIPIPAPKKKESKEARPTKQVKAAPKAPKRAVASKPTKAKQKTAPPKKEKSKKKKSKEHPY